MSEIKSLPYPEPWGEVQQLVAGPVWLGVVERELLELADVLRVFADAERGNGAYVRLLAGRLEQSHSGDGHQAVRSDADLLEDHALRCEKAAKLLDEAAHEVLEAKIDLSVIGARAQRDQETWQIVLKETAGAHWAQKLAEKSLEKAKAKARARADEAEAFFAAKIRDLAALGFEAQQPERRPDLEEVEGPAASRRVEPGSEAAGTQAMSANAPVAERHKHDEHHDQGQDDDQQAGSTSVMSAAPVVGMAGGAVAAGHTPTSYGHFGSHHDARALDHAGASGLVDGEDPDQWLVDLAGAVLARIVGSVWDSPYAMDSPLRDLFAPVWLSVESWWDADMQAGLSLSTGAGMGRWVPPGHKVPERVVLRVLGRDLRERPAQTARACFPRLARSEGGRLALVAVAGNITPYEGDADCLRDTNRDNEDGFRREALLVGADPDGGGDAGGFLCHRLQHLNEDAMRLVGDVPAHLLGTAAVEVAYAAANAADTNAAEDDVLQAVVGAWRIGNAPGEGEWQAVKDLVRQSAWQCGEIRAQLGSLPPDEVADMAGDMAQPASVFSAGAAVLLAPGVWQQAGEQDARERLGDVAYELFLAGGDLAALRAALGRSAPSAPGGHWGVVR